MSKENVQRISDAVKLALKYGQDVMQIIDFESGELAQFSRFLMCPTTGISYVEPEPNLFSFNSPYGACKRCNGLGTVSEVDINKVIPNTKKSIKEGGIIPLGKLKNDWIGTQIETVLAAYGHKPTDKIADIDEEVIQKLLFGFEELLTIEDEKKTV